MSWTTSTTELRTLLSDGPKDRFRYRKKVFGEVNATNRMFRTFEMRRSTSLTTATAPLGVWLNGVLLSNTLVVADYQETGDFKLAASPTLVLADGDVLEASYYVQWFLDSELAEFMQRAAEWLGLGANVTVVPAGLQPAALKYAVSEAYQKLAIRWSEHMSETYRVEDSPDYKQTTNAQKFLDMSKTFREDATNLRDQYYTRQGQSLQPLFGTVLGNVSRVTPRT